MRVKIRGHHRCNGTGISSLSDYPITTDTVLSNLSVYALFTHNFLTRHVDPSLLQLMEKRKINRK